MVETQAAPAEAAAEGFVATVAIRVPNRFKLDWIRAQYAGRIEAVLSELAGARVKLELSVVASRTEAASLPLKRPPMVAAASVPVLANGANGAHGALGVYSGADAASARSPRCASSRLHERRHPPRTA